MRPIPAPRLGDAHGLLRAIDRRERLRLDEFVTEFTVEELFPPGLENALGRTRQFVSYARAAGLLDEDRGTVELTGMGKRYVRAADAAQPFEVAPAQAVWLRRLLRERHMTDSIFHGAAVGLSLLASNPPGFHASPLDFGRALAHLGRAGWDNDNTLASQGERYVTFLRDLELIDADERLTEAGEQTRDELTLPVHMSLKDLVAQLNPDAAMHDAAAAPAVEEEEDEYEDVGPAPAPEAPPAPPEAPPAPPEPAPPEPAQATAAVATVASPRSAPPALVPAAAIRTAAQEAGLVLPDGVYAAVAAALDGGHVVLTGPPGSGKTTLALAVAKAAARAGRSGGATLVTAGHRWSARETLGRRGPDGWESGIVVGAASQGRWLLVDELDRARLDRALGELSSFLAGAPVALPEGELEPPPEWRIVATATRATLAGSAALARRFAHVAVPPPAGPDLERAIAAAAAGDATAADAATRLLPARELGPVGTGAFLAAARFAAARNAAAPADAATLAREALAAHVAPLLGELDEDARRRLAALPG